MTAIVQSVEEADFAEMARVDVVAMAENPVVQVLFSFFPDREDQQKFFIEFVRSIWIQNRNTCWKIVDPETKSIVAFALYRFERSPEPKTHTKSSDAQTTNEPSPVQKVMTAMWSTWEAYKKEHCDGKPHATLNCLETLQDHRGKGYGALLLQKGNDAADQLGLSLHLYSTSKARPLYERKGYENMGTDSMNLECYGVNETTTRSIMKRLPKEQ